MNARKRKLILMLILTLLWTAFIFHRSLQPADVSHEESIGLLNPLQRLFPWLSHNLLRKIAHFVEYFVLGALAWTDLRLMRRKAWPGLLYCLAAAGADECIQRFVPGRSGQLSDVLLDFVGSLAAVLLLALIARLAAKHRNGGRDHGRKE